MEASLKVKELLLLCKQKHKLWVSTGKTDKLRKECVLAKCSLRKQLRKEKFNDRKNFYNKLMQNPKLTNSTDSYGKIGVAVT